MATARFQVVSLPRSVADSVHVPAQQSKDRSSVARQTAKQVRPSPPPPRRFTWRFLAANNRSLAMAVEVFPDAGSCIAAMHELKRGLADAACEFSRDEDGLWRWQVRVDGTVAASSNSYRRQLRAKITCDTFFALADDPAAMDNVQVVYR